ncbi:MAG: short-chain dehydrogenase/reductase [Frankiales bacterium]|nr:short-chain dehydrogenase/reductase [Frankiales bacterium]
MSTAPLRTELPNDPFDLSGSVALVTGASRGIGLASARMLAGRGAAVVLASNEPDACEDAAAALRADGRSAIGVGCDVSDRAQVADLVAATVGRFGRLDAVVSNVGIIPTPGPLADVDDATYDRVMTTNLRSGWWLALEALPLLAADGGGSIVFTASIAALRGSSAVGLYSLTKAGLVSLARNLAVEWGPHSVRVNAIAPGLIGTDMTRATVENPDLVARRIAGTPLRRIGRPDDIAGAVAFLVSPAAAFVTGHTLVVDGGVTANLGN